MGSSHSKVACGCRYLLKGRYGKEYSIPSCVSEVTIERTEREIRKIKARQLVAKKKGYLKARGLKRGVSSCAPRKVFQDERPMKSIKNFLEMGTVEAIFDRLLDNVLGEEKDHSLAEGKDLATAKEKIITSLVANKVEPLNSTQESVVEDNRLHHKTLERCQAEKIFVGDTIPNALKIGSDAKEIACKTQNQPAVDSSEESSRNQMGAIKVYVDDIIAKAIKIVQNDGENQLDSEEEDNTSQKAPVAQHDLPLDIKVEGTVTDMPYEDHNQVPSESKNEGLHSIIDLDAVKICVKADIIVSALDTIQMDREEPFKAEQQSAETTALPHAWYLSLDTEEEEAVEVSVKLPSKAEDLALDSEAKNVPSALGMDAIKVYVEDIVQNDGHMSCETDHTLPLDIAVEFTTAEETSNDIANLPLDTEVEEEETTVEKLSEAKQQPMYKEAQNSQDMDVINVYVNDMIVKAMNAVQKEADEHFKAEQLVVLDDEEEEATSQTSFETDCYTLNMAVEEDEATREIAYDAEQQLHLTCNDKETTGTLDRNVIKANVDDIIVNALNIVQKDDQTPTETEFYQMDAVEEEITVPKASDSQYLLSLDTKVEKEEGIVEKPSEGEELSLDSSGEERDSMVDMNDIKSCVDDIIDSVVNIVQNDKQTPSETDIYHMDTAKVQVTTIEASNGHCLFLLDTKVEKEEGIVAKPSEEKELSLDSIGEERDGAVDMKAEKAEAECNRLNMEVVNEADELRLEFSGEETDSTVYMNEINGYVCSINASAVNIIQKNEHTPSETKYTVEEEVMATEASDALRVLPLDTKVEKEEAKVGKASEELFLYSNDKTRNSTGDIDAKGCDDSIIPSALSIIQDERAISNGSLSHSLDSKVDTFVNNIIANAVKVVSDELAAVSKETIEETTNVNVEELTDENVDHCPFYDTDKQDSVTYTEPTMNAAEITSNAGVSNTAGKNGDFCSIVVKDNEELLTVVKIDPTKIVAVESISNTAEITSNAGVSNTAEDFCSIVVKDNEELLTVVKIDPTEIIAVETVSNVMEDVLFQEETKEHSSLGHQNKKGTDTVREAGTCPFAANCENHFVGLGRDDVKMSVDGVISNPDIPRQNEARTCTLMPLRDDAEFGSAYKQTTAKDLLIEKKKDAVVMEPPYAMAVLEKVVSMATAFELKHVTDYGEITNHQTLDEKAAVVYSDDTNKEDTTSSCSPVLVSPQFCTDSFISARSLTERSNFVGNTDSLPSVFGYDVSDNDVAEQIPRFSLDGNSERFLPEKLWSRPLKDLECETVQWLIKETPDEQTAGKEGACVKKEHNQSKAAMDSVVLQGIASWDKKSEHTRADDGDLPSIISNEGANTGRDHSILLTDDYALSSFNTRMSPEKDRHSEAETNLSSLPFVRATLEPKLDIAVVDDGPCGADDKPTAVKSNVKTDRTGARTADGDSKKDIQPTTDKETLHDEIRHAHSNDILEHLLSNKRMASTCYRKCDYPVPPENDHLALSSLDFAQTTSKIRLDTLVNDDGPCGPDVKTSVVKGTVETDRTCALTDEDLNKDQEPTKETETSDDERSYADNSDKLQPLPLEKTTKTKLVTSVDDDGPCGPDIETAIVKSNIKADRTAAFTHDEDLKKDRETTAQTETPNTQNEISYAHSSDNSEPLRLEKRTIITKSDFAADGDGFSGPDCTPPPSQKSSWIGALSSVIPFFGLNDQESSPEESPSVSTGNQAEELQLRPSESFATKVSRWFAGDDDEDIDDQAIEKAELDGVDDERDDDDDDGVEVEEKASSAEFSETLRPTELDETLYELEQAQEKRKEIKLQDEYDIQDVIIAMKEFNKLQTLESVPPRVISMTFVGAFLKARDFMIDEAIKLYANYLVHRKAYSMARLTPFRNPLLSELYSGRFTVLDARDKHGAAITVFTAHLQSLEVNYDVIMNSIYLQLDEVMKSPEIQEHGIVLLYDLSNTNYKTCDVQLCSKIIELLKTAYPVRLRRTLLLSPPFCFEIRLFSAAVFRDPKVRENICSVTQDSLTQYLPVTCIPKSFGGECDVNPLRLIEQCMLSNNTREESMVDSQTGRMSHSAENDDCDVDAVVKDQRWFSLEEMFKDELDSNKTYHNQTITSGSDTKRAMSASDLEKDIENSPEKFKDIGPKCISEKKNCDEVTFARIKPSPSEKKMNGYAWEQKIPVERIIGHTDNDFVEKLNVKPCSSEVNIKYSWEEYERIGGHRHDVSTDAPKLKLCSSERRIIGNSSKHPYVPDRAKKCPSEKKIADARGKHEYVDSRNQRNGGRTSNEETITVGPSSPSILGNTERDVHAGRFTCHYPSRVVPPCLSRLEVVKNERINEREENGGESFISKALVDPIAAVYNFFKF